MDFETAGKVDGIEIWRIENFKAVPYPKEKYGQFHVGDAYIVLKTVLSKSQSSKASKFQGDNWTIHFWLGSEATQDEYGRAWDFNHLEMRNRAVTKLLKDKPRLLIGSPHVHGMQLQGQH